MKMNKKMLGLLLSGMLMVGMVGCSSSEVSNTTEDGTEQTIQNTTAKFTIDEGQEMVYYSSLEDSIQIGITAEGFDNTLISYIYIDGEEYSQDQYGEWVGTSIELTGNVLEEGEHRIEVKQYKDNDTNTEPLVSVSDIYTTQYLEK